jgi:hypothetical protein
MSRGDLSSVLHASSMQKIRHQDVFRVRWLNVFTRSRKSSVRTSEGELRMVIVRIFLASLAAGILGGCSGLDSGMGEHPELDDQHMMGERAELDAQERLVNDRLKKEDRGD